MIFSPLYNFLYQWSWGVQHTAKKIKCTLLVFSMYLSSPSFHFFSSIFLPSPVFISEWSLKVFLGDLKANAAHRSVLWWCKTDFLKWLKAMRWLGQGLCYMFRVQHISAWHPALCKVWWSRAQRHPMVGNKSYQFSATVLGFSLSPTDLCNYLFFI